jgi:hypothetical protein
VLQTPDDGGDVVGCSGAVAITVQMASEALLLLARSDVLAVAIDVRRTEIKQVLGSPWPSFSGWEGMWYEQFCSRDNLPFKWTTNAWCLRI